MVNQLVKQFSQKFRPLKVFKVKSRTNFNPDLGEYEDHNVELWRDKTLFCNCIAGFFKKPCYHKQKIKADLEKEFGSIEKATEHFRNFRKQLFLKKIKQND